MPALLVFGARNLGRAIARRLAADGWEVAAVARSSDSLERVAAEIPEALTPGHDKAKALSSSDGKAAANPTADPSGW